MRNRLVLKYTVVVREFVKYPCNFYQCDIFHLQSAYSNELLK